MTFMSMSVQVSDVLFIVIIQMRMKGKWPRLKQSQFWVPGDLSDKGTHGQIGKALVGTRHPYN